MKVVETSPSEMLPVFMVKGKKYSELCTAFCAICPRNNSTSTYMSSASKQRQAKASQMAMPNFKWEGKRNLTRFLEGGESEIFGELH